MTSKTVVITGASSGVGRATALAFAAQGYRVGLIARGREGLQGAQKEIESRGGRAAHYSCDVADFHGLEAAARHLEDELGEIDVWVNNAMTTVFAPLEKISADEFRRVTEVTYHGQVFGTMVALNLMRPRNRGVIVSVGSALGFRGIPLQTAYCGAKHAVQGFMESVRTELLHEGSKIELSQVHLPAVNTPQFDNCRAKMPRHPQPVPPIYQPEVCADAIVWAAEHHRREIHVGYSAVGTIWGNRLVPWVLDHKLARNGFESQQTDEEMEGDRPGNLFEPVEGDHGARGQFDGRSYERSPQLWASKHRPGVIGSALAVGAAATAALIRSLKGDG